MKKDISQAVTLKLLFIRYRFYLIILIILSLLANIINLIIPNLISQIIDKSIKTNNQFDTVFVSITLGLVFVGLILALLEFSFGIIFSEKFAKNLRIDSFSNLTKQPYQYVLQEGSSNLITIFGSDVDNIQDNFTTTLSYLIQAIVLFVGANIAMFLISWKLAIVAILSLPLIILGFMYSLRKVNKYFELSQSNLTTLNNVVSENINASNLIRILSSSTWEEKKFDNANYQAKEISINIIRIFSILLPFINFVTNSVIVIFLYLGARDLAIGQLTIGQLSSFLAYYALLITPIFILGFTSQGITQALTSWKRISPILNNRDQVIEGSYESNKIEGNIEVVNLTLELTGKKTLNNISFTITSGQKTAILGPTGAGKSQLFNLLLGLGKATSGNILIDNVDIKEWNKSSFLSRVGICFQESIIFNTTIRANIILDRNINQEDLEIAIKTANLESFVESLPDGLDTIVGERGANLSGGQKQRLTLARAIVFKPDLILLDDFTARVDIATEEKIKDLLEKNYPKTQIIQICQKIESIKDYDNIIVLMEGQLVGQGTHLELLKNCSEYQQIFNSQQII